MSKFAGLESDYCLPGGCTCLRSKFKLESSPQTNKKKSKSRQKTHESCKKRYYTVILFNVYFAAVDDYISEPEEEVIEDGEEVPKGEEEDEEFLEGAHSEIDEVVVDPEVKILLLGLKYCKLIFRVFRQFFIDTVLNCPKSCKNNQSI